MSMSMNGLALSLSHVLPLNHYCSRNPLSEQGLHTGRLNRTREAIYGENVPWGEPLPATGEYRANPIGAARRNQGLIFRSLQKCEQ